MIKINNVLTIHQYRIGSYYIIYNKTFNLELKYQLYNTQQHNQIRYNTKSYINISIVNCNINT